VLETDQGRRTRVARESTADQVKRHRRENHCVH